jgi:two-component system, NtrC family, sensor kinase
MSATPDSTLANPEQRIADLERQLAEREAELAERTAERDEALEQQTATAEVLQVINSSPGELAPVFEVMLDKALALCGATYGGLSTFDGDCFHLVAGRGHPEYHAWLRQQHGPLRPAPGSTLARIVGGEDAVQIPDIADDKLYRSGASPGRRALVEIGGFHTLLIVALRKDNILLGTIAVYRQEVRPFHRQADRTAGRLRCASGHRDGERAAHHRDPRSARTADRHRCGSSGDQLLAG